MRGAVTATLGVPGIVVSINPATPEHLMGVPGLGEPREPLEPLDPRARHESHAPCGHREICGCDPERCMGLPGLGEFRDPSNPTDPTNPTSPMGAAKLAGVVSPCEKKRMGLAGLDGVGGIRGTLNAGSSFRGIGCAQGCECN